MEQHDAVAGFWNGAVQGVAELVVDVWRIGRRADRDGASEAVRIACETAVDRLASLGFRFDELLGEPYDENLRVRVVHKEGGERNVRISECLSPAVYFRNELIRPAEIVIQGEGEDGSADGGFRHRPGHD
jgi:hypothetical protein